MSKAERADAPTPVPIKNPEPLPSVELANKKGKGKETYKEAIFRLENDSLTVRQARVQAGLLVESGDVHAAK